MRQAAYAAAAVLMVVLISVVLAQMKPAAPTVERATVWVDTVKRGSMVRQVRGLGTLVPEDTRWLPATTLGRVERIVLRPGAEVHAGSVILELSNPQVEQETSPASAALCRPNQRPWTVQRRRRRRRCCWPRAGTAPPTPRAGG